MSIDKKDVGQVKLRLALPLKKRLQDEATLAKRSFSAEIEKRLEESFERTAKKGKQ